MNDSLTSLTKKEEMSENEGFAHFFNNFFFNPIISSEPPELIAHGRSFVLSDLSNTLTIAHLI